MVFKDGEANSRWYRAGCIKKRNIDDNLYLNGYMASLYSVDHGV